MTLVFFTNDNVTRKTVLDVNHLLKIDAMSRKYGITGIFQHFLRAIMTFPIPEGGVYTSVA